RGSALAVAENGCQGNAGSGMDSPSTEATLWSLTQECESPRNRKSRAVVSRRRLSALGYLNDAGGPLGVYLSAQICHRTAALDPVRRVSLRCLKCRAKWSSTRQNCAVKAWLTHGGARISLRCLGT